MDPTIYTWKRFVLHGLLKPAIDDWRDGQPCGKICHGGVHYCAEDARRFLRSDWAEMLFDFLGVNQELVLKELGL